MNYKSIIYGLLFIIIFREFIHGHREKSLKKQIETHIEIRKKELKLKELELQSKIDSLTKIIEIKEDQISLALTALNKSIKQAKINNIKHENIKNNIPNLSADSISKLWAKRYER